MEKCEGARLETQGGEPVNLLGVKLSGDLRGLMLEARVEQRFVNPGDQNVEVVYSFPLPWGAVLLGVDVVLGGKHLTGTVVEKKQAEARYEEAISEGNAAILLEKNHDHSYSLNLGNLAAREHCTITLRYAQTLQFEQRGLRLLIPTVIAPRYGDAQQDGGLRPHQTPSHSLLAEHPFALELRLHGDLAQARVASPSHPVSVAQGKTEAGAVLTVSLARQAALDRDFVLVVDQLAHDSMGVAARDSATPGAVAILASFCPRIAVQGPATTAVKILVDCSGSMAGDSIDAAKRALQAIVRQLGTGDRFSLSRFGSTVEHRARGLWNATETTQLAAQRWVGALQANLGGTKMEAALASTFALAHTDSSDVLLVTDGEISAIDSTIASAQDSGHRVFIVGIGSCPAETHVRRLAEATGGACDFVAPGEAVEPAVLRMFARLRSPRLAHLHIDWPAGTVPHWVSPLRPSVFDGDTVNVYAVLAQAPAGPVRLLGQRAEDDAPQEIGCAAFVGEIEAADTLARVAASARLRTPTIHTKAVTLAVAYQLVTDRTNFLLVHERAEGEQATDMPTLQTVAQMVPAGWGGAGSVLYSKSSTMAPQAFAAPAFLRRQSDDTAPAAYLRKHVQIIGYQDPRFWTKSEHYEGLTPLGVGEWLRSTPASQWPSTYVGLRQMGLGVGLVDWLELAVASHAGTLHTESQVVAAFLHLMARRDTYESLAAGSAVAAPASVDMDLVETIATGLDGMATNAWPDRVFELGGAVAEIR